MSNKVVIRPCDAAAHPVLRHGGRGLIDVGSGRGSETEPDLVYEFQLRSVHGQERFHDLRHQFVMWFWRMSVSIHGHLTHETLPETQTQCVTRGGTKLKRRGGGGGFNQFDQLLSENFGKMNFFEPVARVPWALSPRNMDTTCLHPVYVVCDKVMFSVVSCPNVVCLGCSFNFSSWPIWDWEWKYSSERLIFHPTGRPARPL